MFKIIFKLFFILFLIAALIIGAGFYILNSADLTQEIVPFVFNKFVNNVNIDKLSIEKQKLDLSFAFNVTKLDISINVGKNKYDIEFDSFDIKKPGLFSLSKDMARVSLKNFTLFSKDLVIKNGEVDLSSATDFSGVGPVVGSFDSDYIKYLNYKIRDVSGNLIGEKTKCKIKDLKAKVYGGTLDGKITMDCSKDFNYVLNASIKGVDLRQLEQVEGAFSNVRGIVDGDLEISGDVNGDNKIKGSVWAVKDGEIKAALLKLLLDYIPQSTQKKEVDALIKSDGNLPLDLAVVNLDSASDDKLLTKIKLKSNKVNLDINLDLELNIEGGIKNLINIQKQVF